MADVLMEVRDVCKSFANDGVQNHVLNGVGLSVGAGDFVAVMGSSGSGKSTLLYAISGMDRATSGSVLYGGEDLAKMPEKRLTRLRCGDFGFVFQQSHLVPNLTLRENIAVPGYMNKRMANREVDERVDELLGLLDLEEAARRYPNQVSGGQQQRCAIARGVINEPALLFADEPTGALNRANSDAVLDLFCELNRRGQTVFMVTHDIKSAIRANRIIYLEDGRVAGELALARYSGADYSREEQATAWLSSLGW